VLSRGNNLSDIFLSDDDRNDFIDILAEMSERFDIEICCYVLMSNHYHLLIETPAGRRVLIDGAASTGG